MGGGVFQKQIPRGLKPARKDNREAEFGAAEAAPFRKTFTVCLRDIFATARLGDVFTAPFRNILTATLYFRAFLLVALLAAVAVAQAQQDVVMQAMRDELARSVGQLRLQNMERPYFIGYRVDDLDDITVAATLGSLTQSSVSHRRTLGVELRVGEYALDNSNFLSFRSAGGAGGRMFSALTQVPLDNNYQVMRRQLWLVTDAEYKKALEDFSAKRATLANRKRPEEVPDFSKEPPNQSQEAPLEAKFDVRGAEQLVRELSAAFRQMPDMFTSSAAIEFHNTYTRYVNSEGSEFTRPQALLRMVVNASTQAADGQPLNDSLEYFGRTLADLPAREKLAAQVGEMTARLAKLRTASFAERYNGPVLFEDEAAGEVFAQVFAPGLVAMRTPMSDNPQFEMAFDQFTNRMGGGSLLEKIGGRVLPETVGLVDNPLLHQFQSAPLAGFYRVDDDGVRARETKLVERGILKTLLASRTPVPGIEHSTGNRRGSGPTPSNLVLTAEKTLSNEDLRQELLRRAKQRGRDYGIIVRRVGGGLNPMAQMQMLGPRDDQPGNTLLAVYKLFADGHEELVRGAEVPDLTTAAFRDIVGVGNKPVVYSDQFIPRGGSVFTMGLFSFAQAMPVTSYVVPSLLFEEISLKKTTGAFPQPPASQSPLAKEGAK